MSGALPGSPGALAASMAVYAVTSDGWLARVGDRLEAELAAMIDAGVTAVQFRCRVLPEHDRARLAERVIACARERGALAVVNDDVDLALATGAHAVHLGPGDLPIDVARARVGDRLLIGASAGSAQAARAAVRAGADYLGVGAIHEARPSKPDASPPRGLRVLEEIRAQEETRLVPVVAIGGIDVGSAGACVLAGADGVAVIRALFDAPEPADAARALRRVVVDAQDRRPGARRG